MSMEQKKTALRVALGMLAALTLAGMVPHTALADGDKDKKKKDPVPIVIGPITTTPDNPPKKK